MSWKDSFPRQNIYYETENGILYNGDCLDIMASFKDKSVDLILTDPPYGIGTAMNGKVGGAKPFGKGGKVGGGNCVEPTAYGYQEWDKEIPKKECFDNMFRVSKNQIMFGGNFFVEYLHNSPCWIVWDKVNGKTNFADCELAWTSFKKSVKQYTILWNGMLRVEKRYKRVHPTQKPITLFVRILDDFSKDNEIILDPFLGSGTTAVACEKMSRRWIGIEISERYCKASAERIKEEIKQLKLF